MTHRLVELAHETLARLEDDPATRDSARAARAEIDELERRPLAIGIGGKLLARTIAFNAVCGEEVLDPNGRGLGSAPLRARRGSQTKLRVVHEKGPGEELVRPPSRAHDLAAANERVELVRGETITRSVALHMIDRSVPAIARVRPVWWAFWLWIAYWISRWLARARLAERVPAELALDNARARQSVIEKEVAAVETDVRVEFLRYRELVREWTGGGPQAGVLEIELFVADGPLPDGVELVELSNASRAGAIVDAVFVAEHDGLFAPVRDGEQPVPLAATVVDALVALHELASHARSMGIARRLRLRLEVLLRAVEAELERSEVSFRARLRDLEDMRVVHRGEFVDEQLATAQPHIMACVNTVIEHAATHLASELAQLKAGWIGALANAKNADELKAAFARVSMTWETSARRVAGEVRLLFKGGLGGSARDLYPALVASLVRRGLPSEHAVLHAAPDVPPVDILPSLDEPRKLDAPGWLTGLFRSFESRRTELRETVHTRIERLITLASAEVLDAEPRLQTTITAALRPLLTRALQHQTEWLDARLAIERAEIDDQRASLVRARDLVRSNRDELSAQLEQLESLEPAISVAASAAETASLSR